MSRTIFLSYEFVESEIALTLPSWFQKYGGACQGTLLTVDSQKRTTPEIDAKIRDMMKVCDIAIFLKSDNVHNKPWIDREAEIAISLGIPIVVVPLPDCDAGPPNRLAGQNDVIYVENWDPDELCCTLNRIVV